MVQLQKGNQKIFNTEVGYDDHIISRSSVMKMLKSRAEEVSRSSLPALILGENGTGKRLIAEYIFKAKQETENSFYSVNCYELDSHFVQTDLFEQKENLFNKTNSCTLYVQGIEQLSLDAQALLLRITQDYAHKLHFIASSREDLPARVKNKTFLPELFHYLSQNILIIPLLKERAEDIPKLITYFLQKGKYKKSIEQKAFKLLQTNSLKGNVSELKAICEKLGAIDEAQETITVDHLLEHIKNIDDLSFFVRYNPKITLEDLTRYYISESLKHYKSKKVAAKALGISIKTIYNKIEKGLV